MKASGQKGFTLLELLVAVALTSVLIIGLMAVFRNMVIVYAQMRESRESDMQMRTLIGLLGDDLRTMARDFAFIGSTGESGGRVLPRASAFVSRGDMDGSAIRLLEFVSGISVEQQEVGPVMRRVLVIYSLARLGDDELWTLMRTERPHPSIDAGWDTLPLPVLRNVEALKFYYEWSRDSVRDYCAVNPGGVLPVFVRLEVVVRQGENSVNYSARFPVAPRL